MRIINKRVLNEVVANATIWGADLVALFLPRHCAGCDTGLNRNEECLCLACLEDLPRTRYHEDPSNPVEQLFWGKVPIHAASAFLHFARSGVTQRMLHRLKYKKDHDVGSMLGGLMATELRDSPRFGSVDAFIPVPLHPKKERIRGFNQSKLLVEGMNKVWPKPMLNDQLLRVVQTTTQTRRGRLDRWTNVKEAFHIPDPVALQGLHVLLVDDVVTTGATIEGCVKALAVVPRIKVSLFTAACA
ncbi:MAG: ComF family protein [Flavobacteriales bacterium]|nr:ComF family protein [Flavobacteriales bacterium]